ncbi:MAG: archease [Caldimicrobium sp.]|nr:archease [Caldimicrobium sp.]MCX7873267.1 archease [Caldimicrobium sp.]MDW8094723.1 archease [Caldimicrobium sp.]
MRLQYETFEHMADVGIRGYGNTPEEALSNLLKALATLLVEDSSFLEERPLFEVELTQSAEFLDELLVNFVNQVLSLTYLENKIFYEFKGELKAEEGRYLLVGKILGVPFDPTRYGYGVEVKGATFTLSKFQREDSQFVAQCVVDV